jgi:hypothetical protein
VKKSGLLCACVLLLALRCALLTKEVPQFAWPERIDHLEAVCDLDMSWRGIKYSGSASVKMTYPDEFQIEVYGAFGDTVLYLRKDRDTFFLRTKEETTTDEAGFEKRFGVRLSEFMDDIAMRGPREVVGGVLSIQRRDYTVFYTFDHQENMICWRGEDGTIRLHFLEAIFDKEVSLGDNRRGQM